MIRRTFCCCLCAAFAAILVASGPLRAANVIISADNSNTLPIIDLTGFMTEGDDMAGMTVTAHFAADFGIGASQTVAWTPTGPGAGSAVGLGWGLRESGDTFTQRWALDVTEDNVFIDRLQITGFPRRPSEVREGTVFDRTEPSFGTDGSYRGRDFESVFAVGDWTDLRVIYRDLVDSLADGPGAVTDLYREMDVVFGRVVLLGGQPVFDVVPFDFDDQLSFRQDTDTVGLRGPGDCVGTECLPEPATWALLGISSVFMLPYMQARRKQVAAQRRPS